MASRPLSQSTLLPGLIDAQLAGKSILVRRPVGTHGAQSLSLANLAQYAFKPVTFRTRHSFGSQIGLVRDPRAVWENSSIIGGNDTSLTGLSDMTLTASIEVSGTRYQLSFGGTASTVLKPGRAIIHDRLPFHVRQLLTSAPTFYYLTCPVMAEGMPWPSNLVTATERGEGNNAATGGDATVSGTIPNVFGWGYGPSVILGKVSALARTFAIIGDSIAMGEGNAPYVDRSYIEEGLADRWGTLKLARSGETASQFASASVSGRRRGLLIEANATDAVYEYGINDTANGRTFAQLKSDTIANWAFLRSVGIQRIHGCTLTPRVSTTDNLTTLAGQTPVSGESVRVAYNDWLRGGAEGWTDSLIDAAASVEEGGASAPAGKWRVNGANWWLSVDGIHPSAHAHRNPLKDAVQTIFPLS